MTAARVHERPTLNEIFSFEILCFKTTTQIVFDNCGDLDLHLFCIRADAMITLGGGLVIGYAYGKVDLSAQLS